MKVRTRKGYAKNGNGDVVGSNCAPQKILAEVMTKRIEAATPRRRTPIANSLGRLMSRRAVAHKAVPAAKEGTLSAKLPAVPESITPSPIANTRNPAATISFPFLTNFNVNKLAAITRPVPSIAQKVLRRLAWATNVPAMPNTAPRARPTAATMFNALCVVGFIWDFPLKLEFPLSTFRRPKHTPDHRPIQLRVENSNRKE
jgi:hypothetical protein